MAVTCVMASHGSQGGRPSPSDDDADGSSAMNESPCAPPALAPADDAAPAAAGTAPHWPVSRICLRLRPRRRHQSAALPWSESTSSKPNSRARLDRRSASSDVDSAASTASERMASSGVQIPPTPLLAAAAAAESILLEHADEEEAEEATSSNRSQRRTGSVAVCRVRSAALSEPASSSGRHPSAAHSAAAVAVQVTRTSTSTGQRGASVPMDTAEAGGPVGALGPSDCRSAPL